MNVVTEAQLNSRFPNISPHWLFVSCLTYSRHFANVTFLSVTLYNQPRLSVCMSVCLSISLSVGLHVMIKEYWYYLILLSIVHYFLVYRYFIQLSILSLWIHFWIYKEVHKQWVNKTMLYCTIDAITCRLKQSLSMYCSYNTV